MTNKKGIATECPHCGVLVLFDPRTQLIKTSYSKIEEVTETDTKGHKTTYERPFNYEDSVFVGICPQCEHPSLVGREECVEIPQLGCEFTYPRLIKTPDEQLPKSIQKALEEIYKCDAVNARWAVAVMSRRFLEDCCSTCGIIKGKLPRRIEELLRHKFPNETLLKRAHLVRSIGDEGAHSFGDVDWDEAKATVLFCEELAHHLFITERQFQKIIEERKKHGKRVGQ